MAIADRLHGSESCCVKEGWSKQKAWSRKKRSQTADIGRIRPVKNRRRKNACRLNLFRFLTTYFPNSTGLRPFSEDHKRVIARIESCILHGGRNANVVFRGFAKTTISENSILWATLYGHRKFIPLFGANEEAAIENIKSIKRELEENDLLDEDFPEVTQAVLALEGKPQRCQSQTCEGLPTFIEWTADKIVYPAIHKSICSGAAIVAKGITGASRGMKHKRPDGTQQRPDFVVIDDPQTDESAASPAQTAKRLGVIAKSILKMAGHRSSIACVVNGTVIQPGDLMDTLLDQKRSSAWQSERIPMIRKWADAHDKLWMEEYAAIRRGFNPAIVGDQQRAHRDANAFYAANREAMDAGCLMSWYWCFIEESDGDAVPELSAIQHAYNLLIDDGEEVFASECQCQPLKPQTDEQRPITPEVVLARLNRIPRGTVPGPATVLTAFVDCSKEVLYWLVAGWWEGFSGAVVDYGSYPDQGRVYFPHSDIKQTLQDELPNAGEEAQLFRGLQQCTQWLLSKEWPIDGGGSMRIRRLLVDAGKWTDTVFAFARQSPFNAIINPSMGRYVGAARGFLAPARPEKRETPGEGSKLGPAHRHPGLRYMQFDSNHWKSQLAARLLTPLGAPGALVLCGPQESEHRMLADHLSAEFRVQAQAGSLVKDEWQQIPNRDNHWWDCLVGATLAASWEKIRLAETARQPRAVATGPRMRVNLPAAPGRSSFFVTNR